MNNALAVRIIERSQDTGDHVKRFLRGERPVLRDDFAQSLSFNKLHDNKGNLNFPAATFGERFFTGVVDTHNARVVQAGC